MDRERLDALIDSELRRALDVEPSGAFEARLRERLAVERERRAGWAGWAGLLAVAAIVIAVILARSPREARKPSSLAPRIATTPPPAVGPVAAGPTHQDAIAPEPRQPVAIARARRLGLHEVEVIVPRGQADALKRFADSLNDNAAKGLVIPVLAEGAPAAAGVPIAATIEHLPMAGSYDSIERK